MLSKKEAIEALRGFGIRPGSKIYVKVDTVSKSGMSRTLSAYIPYRGKTKDADCIFDITLYVGWACELPITKDQTIRIHGGGMDMSSELVYQLGMAMFPKGFRCTERRDAQGRITRECSSFNYIGNHDEATWHKSGGYALRKQGL